MKLKDVKVEYGSFLTGKIPVKIGNFEVTGRSSIELLMPNGDFYRIQKEYWAGEEFFQLCLKKAAEERYSQLHKAVEVNWEEAEIIIIRTDITHSSGTCYESTRYYAFYNNKHNIYNYTQKHEYSPYACGYESDPCESKFKELGLDLGVKYYSWCDSSD